MRVLVLGGHGKVARLLTPRLVERGHLVTAVVRNPDHVADVESDGATASVADVETMDVPSLARLVHGQDAVVWSAGAGGGDPTRTYAVDRDAAIRSIDAAEQAWVRRYVMVSYLGAGPDHGVPPDDPFFPYADAKSAADAHLASSGLAWTVLRPSRLTDDEPTGLIASGSMGTGRNPVTRGDVAHVVCEAVARPRLAGRVVEFTNGAVPVAEELDALER